MDSKCLITMIYISQTHTQKDCTQNIFSVFNASLCFSLSCLQVTPDCLKAKAEEAKAFAEKNMPKEHNITSFS